MKERTRDQQVLDILKENGHTTVHTLCRTLYLSEATVRRCLADLERRGLIQRTHGGAALPDNYTHAGPFRSRITQNASAKRQIAEKAAALVPGGSIVFLDQSSTSYYLAEKLKEKSALTVVTNSIEIAACLAQTDFQVLVSGGQLCADARMCLVGADAHRTFQQINADFVFFSTRSLSADGVISDCNRDEINVRSAMLQNAACRVFLCDSSKFGTSSGYVQCTLADIDMLISEGNNARQYAERYQQLKML